MRNLIIAFALMFSAVTFGQMTFSIDNSWDTNMPLSHTANIGWFMTDDIMVSVGMSSWDDFSVTARYYTGFCDNMFIQAGTTAVETGADTGDSQYDIGAAVGWTKSLGIWKLQFEPMVVLDDIQNFEPRLAWGFRFNL